MQIDDARICSISQCRSTRQQTFYFNDSLRTHCWTTDPLRSRALQAKVASTLHDDETEHEKVCFMEKTTTKKETYYKGKYEETEKEAGLLMFSNGNWKMVGTHFQSQYEEEEKEEQEFSTIRDHNHVQGQADHNKDAIALVAVVQTCTKQKDFRSGSRIHADIITRGLLQTNVFIGSAVVNMYAKWGSLLTAQEVFDTLGVRDVVAWNALIAGYVQHGHTEEALNSFEHMQLEGVSPNEITLSSILKVCISIGAVDKGQELHAQLVREGLLEDDIVLGTALVDFYARIGFLEKAQEVFDKISNPNVVSWTVLIGGYAYYGHAEEVFGVYKQMQLEGVSPSAYTLIWVLKASASSGAIDTGQELHSQIVKDGLLARDMFVGTALVDMYAKCGALLKAQEVCDELLFRDTATLNSLISGYTEHGHGEKALYSFEQMELEGLSPDRVTFACALKACGSIGAIKKGQELHNRIITEGWLEKDNFISAALVDMYVKFGLLEKAQEVFDKLPVQDVVSWNSLITGYAQQGYFEEALRCYERNHHEALLPDAITFVCILNACGSMGAADKGEKIHAEIVKCGLLAYNIVTFNALMDMYSKCYLLEEAQKVFDNLLVRDVVSWNTLITGLTHHGHDEECLHYFELMQIEGFSPSLITFACIFKACGSMGAAHKGHALHVEIVKDGLLETDLIIGTSMVDMYANCGMLAEAQGIFDNLSDRNVITWNALIAAYTQVGYATTVFHSFNKMINEGVMPDLVTFTILLNTCSHTGLLDMGHMYFEVMSTCYGIPPGLEHYTCMIDLFGRAGHLDQAVALIEEMPFSASLMIWHTLLRSCGRFKTFLLAKSAFEHAAQLNEMNGAAYFCFKNIYMDTVGEESACLIDSISEATGREELLV